MNICPELFSRTLIKRTPKLNMSDLWMLKWVKSYL